MDSARRQSRQPGAGQVRRDAGRPDLTGSDLGVYQVEALIGVGAMGEVYRARDTKLGRTVAIKVLPDSFSHDSDRLARFEREARALAALNHLNIATIHGLEDFESVDATGVVTIRGLVLEFVEGETLDDRIRNGLTLDQALPLARQIAWKRFREPPSKVVQVLAIREREVE